METSLHVCHIEIADMISISAIFSSSPRTDVSFIFHQNAMLRIEFPLKTLLHVFDIENVDMSLIIAFFSSSPQTDVALNFHQILVRDSHVSHMRVQGEYKQSAYQ